MDSVIAPSLIYKTAFIKKNYSVLQAIHHLRYFSNFDFYPLESRNLLNNYHLEIPQLEFGLAYTIPPSSVPQLFPIDLAIAVQCLECQLHAAEISFL